MKKIIFSFMLFLSCVQQRNDSKDQALNLLNKMFKYECLLKNEIRTIIVFSEKSLRHDTTFVLPDSFLNILQSSWFDFKKRFEEFDSICNKSLHISQPLKQVHEIYDTHLFHEYSHIIEMLKLRRIHAKQYKNILRKSIMIDSISNQCLKIVCSTNF